MRRLLALVVLVVSTTLVLATPAHAGGPTSVLITDPSAGEATALYYSDPAYGELDGMLIGAVPLDREPSDLGARSVHLTWMAHDVAPWKTQQLYLEAALVYWLICLVLSAGQARLETRLERHVAR